jgi:predicted O-methyltransferase YrrM
VTWYARSQPNEITPVPWLSAEAVTYLLGLLKPEFNVIEFGGGGSTLWIAKHVAFVTTYEPDPDWYREISVRAPYKVRVVLGNAPPITYCHYDLMFIDGEPVEERGPWLVAAPNLVKPGGYLVLDNANRPEYAKERAALGVELLERFDGNDGTKYLVTEFYRMRSDASRQ